MNQTVKALGKLTITLTKADGSVFTQEVKNLVVDTGLAYLASRACNNSTTAVSHMAIGTGRTSPAAGQTTLTTEIARVALYSSSNVGGVISFVANFPAGTGTGTITEAGIFNSNSGGTMLCRSLFSLPVVKDVGDSLNILWSTTLTV